MSHDQFNMTAFHGGPKTTDTIDDYGVPTIEVRPVAVDPYWKKVARWVGVAVLIPAVMYLAVDLMNSPGKEADWIGAGFGLLFALCCVRMLKDSISTVKRHVKFTPTAFLVKRGEFPFGHHWDVFELNQPVRFTMIPHDHALWEREDNEYRKASASTNGRAIKPDSLYQNSYHVCLEHFGQRHDIITVLGRKEATAILTRLKACLEINKARAGKSGSTATEPSQQWKSMPGGLPGPGRVSNLH